MDSWAASVASLAAVGRGWAACSPHVLPPAVKSTSAGDAQEICFHLFWPRLVRTPQDLRGQLGGWGQEGAHHKQHAQPTSQPWNSCLDAGSGGTQFPGSPSLTRLTAGLLMMPLNSSAKHLFPQNGLLQEANQRPGPGGDQMTKNPPVPKTHRF